MRLNRISGILIAIVFIAGNALALSRSIDSLWPEKSIAIDGRGLEWPLMPVLETKGFSFRAMNDADHLYLLISATTDDGRTILAGKFRQDVTLWAMSPDHKQRLWGLRIPFSARLTPSGDANPTNTTLATLGVTPVKVTQEGVELSTAPWPDSVQIAADLSSEFGRKPVIECSIPLALLAASQRKRAVAFQWSVESVNPDVKRTATAELAPVEQHSEGIDKSSSTAGSGGHRNRRGGDVVSRVAPSVQFPDAVQLRLTVGLAKH